MPLFLWYFIREMKNDQCLVVAASDSMRRETSLKTLIRRLLKKMETLNYCQWKFCLRKTPLSRSGTERDRPGIDFQRYRAEQVINSLTMPARTPNMCRNELTLYTQVGLPRLLLTETLLTFWWLSRYKEDFQALLKTQMCILLLTIAERYHIYARFCLSNEGATDPNETRRNSVLINMLICRM